MKIAYCFLFMLMATEGGLIGCAYQHPMPGGYTVASASREDVIAAADFAVQAIAHQEKRPLHLVKIVKAREQVVAGKNYGLSLRVSDGKRERTANAVVWWQGWRKEEPYQLTSWQWR